MAVRFPAFCPYCGLIFPGPIELANVIGVTFKDVTVSCPRCGKQAELPDGTFDVVDETIHVLAASGLTRARLLRLATLLETVRQDDVDPTEAARAISDEAPELVPLIERFGPRMGRAFVLFLFAAVQILLAQGLAELRDDSATRADVRRAVEEAVERCRTAPP